MQMNPAPLLWRRSTRCAASSCVEAATHADFVYLRDSKDAAGAVLRFDREVWRAFVEGLKSDAFSPR